MMNTTPVIESVAHDAGQISKGSLVQIRPEWQDDGDADLLWVALEDSDGGRVRISPLGHGMAVAPNQVVTLEMISKVDLALRFGRSRNVRAVASIAEAQKLWVAYRDEFNLGGSESPKVTVVRLDTGKMVAEISYNGRAWKPGKMGKELLCEF